MVSECLKYHIFAVGRGDGGRGEGGKGGKGMLVDVFYYISEYDHCYSLDHFKSGGYTPVYKLSTILVGITYIRTVCLMQHYKSFN